MQEIHTSCRDCVFAQYREKTQTGCELGRIDAYRALEPDSVIECYDDNQEFYVVDGRYCSAFRHKDSDWAKHPQSAVERVRLELRIHLTVVAIVDSLNGLDVFLESLLKQTPLPAQVVFCNRGKVKNSELMSKVREITGNQLTWWVNNPAKNVPVDDLSCVSYCKQKMHCNYFTVFNTSSPIPDNFSECLNNSLNEKMERWSVLKPNQAGQGLTVQFNFYKSPSLNGNLPVCYTEEIELTSIVDKAEYLAKLNNKPWIVSEVGSVCPQLA